MEIDHIHLSCVNSTNTYAKSLTSLNPQNVTCITADEQTQGKGRQNKTWHSPPGVNLYATFCFQLLSHTPQITSLSLVMAFSMAQILLTLGLKPKIKWPNDLLLHGKKMCGILCETEFHANSVSIFLGIGVNVNMNASELSKIDKEATSLKKETLKDWDIRDLLQMLENRFVKDLETFKKHGFSSFHDAFEDLLAYKGETVCCFDGKSKWIGICHGLTKDGYLNIQIEGESFHSVLSGDISLRKMS